MSEKINIDVKAGSRAYNRLDMQVSQAVHMAIEIFENVNFLLVMDHYDDITIFDDTDNPQSVSYYQMKTNEDSISFNTILREEWLPKLYKHLAHPDYLIKELGLITNCPVKLGKKLFVEAHTPFSKFNDDTITKIKGDISKKMNIPANSVNLSKFVHIRTTLTIAKHKDMAEYELSNFLKTLYPRITVESVKTIFQSIIDMLTKRQENEEVPDNADFSIVRAKKGVSKDDINRVIKMTMLISLPDFDTILRAGKFQNEDAVSREYVRILADLQKKESGPFSLIQKIQTEMEQHPIVNGEDFFDYVKRTSNIIPNNPIYNDIYKQIIVISILHNIWENA